MDSPKVIVKLEFKYLIYGTLFINLIVKER